MKTTRFFFQYISLALLMLFPFSQAMAQEKNAEISGRVLSKKSGQPVDQAVAQLLRADSTLAAGAYTDSTGLFRLVPAEVGQYILRISFVGFDPLVRNVQLTKEQPALQLDSLWLTGNDILLRGVSITAQAKPMEIVEDTLVYNASAYNVPEGEALEELIKLLPGVEIDDDGKITVNGREVKEFRINGKDFFKGNTEIAMKNLPVELVDKIKTYEKKSDYAEQTGIDDGNEQTVMDIKLKKELNESWISNLDLAYGSEDRYQAKLFANRMTDNSRISLTGGTENTDARNINRRMGVDMNFSNNKKRNEAGRYEIGGHININSRAGHSSSWRSSEQFNTGSSSSFSNSDSYNKNRSNGISGNLRLQWQPDTLSTLTFSPTFRWDKSFGYSRSRSASFNSDPYDLTSNPLDAMFNDDISPELQAIAVNRNGNRSQNNNRNHSLSGNLMYVRRLNRDGRNISFDLSASENRSNGKSYRISDIRYYQRTDNSHTFQNQYTTSPSESWNFSLRTSYSEPLFKGWHLQLSYQFSRDNNDNDRVIYELDSLDGWREDLHELGRLPLGADSLEMALNRENSQYNTQWNTTHRGNISFRLTTGKINAQIGTAIRQQHTRMAYKKNMLDTILTRDVLRFGPNVRINYRKSRSERFEFTYRGNSSDPSLTNRLATTDNSNPLNIHTGNANLSPSWRNSFNFRWNKFVESTMQNWVVELGAEQSNNDISTAVTYDESTGVRHTQPQNINGNWSANGNFTFNTPLDKNNRFNLSTATRLNYDHSVGYLRTSNAQSSSKNVTRNTSVNERLNGRYRYNWLEVSLGGTLRYNHAVNKLRPSANLDTWNYSYSANTRIRLPWKMYLSTDIRMSSRRGYSSAEMNTDELIWNAELSQNFFRGNPLILRLNVYDILQQRSNIRRSISANSRSDSETDASYSYFMAHVIFRLNIFNGKMAFGHRGKQGRDSFQQNGGGGRGNRQGGGGFGGGGFGGGGGRGR